MHSEITYAGNRSTDFDIVVERFPSLNRPARKYEKVSVPGRNGDIYFKQDAWENYTQEYEVWSGGRTSSAPDRWTNILKWLYPEERGTTIEDILNLEVNGYHQLKDSYEPDVIRLAQYVEETEVENSWNRFGKSIIRFDCRPERFTANAFDFVDITSQGVKDTTPYISRTSTSGIVYPKLIGASVGWNQLCNSSSVTVPSGRKYYLLKDGAESIASSTGTAITGLTSGTDMVIDLTLMLGSTIADYLYSLEQATSGSGIAKLKEWGFDLSYHAYDSGSIKSVSASGRKVVGFNVWDEEWEVGTYDINTGEKATHASLMRCKNPIRIVPNTNYYFKSPNNAVFLYYDANMNFISANAGVVANSVVTPPTNASYINFRLAQAYGTTYNNDICINISGDENGTYEPYTSTTYPIANTDLRGRYKLDSSNNLYADGDTYEADGTVTRKYGIVDLGTLTYSKVSAVTNAFVSTANNPTDLPIISTSTVPMWLSDTYPILKYTDVANTSLALDKVISQRNSSAYNGILIKDSAYATYYSDNDTESFKSAMSGKYLVYEKTTSTTETADPYTSPQLVGSTEEWVGAEIPVGQDSLYFGESQMTNPTKRTARPCMKITGSGAGTVTCNGTVIRISDIPQYIYIDSDSQNCFKEISDANLNNLVSLSNGFPILNAGDNQITFGGGVTKVEVMPRWWDL